MMTDAQQMGELDAALESAEEWLEEARNWAKACDLFPFSREIEAARTEVARLLRVFREDRKP